MCDRIWPMLVFIILCLTGCRDGVEPVRTPDLRPPIVTGLYVTNDFVTVETWREPLSQGQIGVFHSVTNINAAIRFILPETGEATVWITPAVLQEEELLNSSGGGFFAQIPGTAIKTFPKQLFPSLAISQVEWDLKDDQGNKVRPGFYRVFVETDTDVLFTDMFVYHDCSDIPHDIKTNVCN